MGMNQKFAGTPSLIERAATAYDFGDVFRTPPVGTAAPLAPASTARAPTPATNSTPVVPVDVKRLRAAGFIVPDGPPTALTEEFRLVKRQLLLNASGVGRAGPIDRGRMILVCSAQPNEGKTFCAVNLALSLASERDTEVLLIDADVAKPEVLSTLGLEGGPGLMDAIADAHVDVEALVVRTDFARRSVLPAGRAAHDDTELLASSRTRDVFARLAEREERIVIMDSAPALAASPASVLALHVGQVLMVVRADRTGEAELRDALALVDGCPNVSLLLNATTFFGGTRKFGSYYGYER
jgi:protein-tyrosine kinase